MDEEKTTLISKIKKEYLFIINVIAKSFKPSISNLTIASFLVAYMIISIILLSLGIVAHTKLVSYIAKISLILLFVSFISGWFQTIKDIDTIEKDENKGYCLTFLEGIGKNIVPVSIGCVICLIFLTIVVYCTNQIALKAFGSLEVIYQDIMNLAQKNGSIIDSINNLSTDKLYTIYAWNLCFALALGIYNYIFMFVLPSIINDDKTNIFLRPFKNLISGVCFTFKNFISTFSIFIFIAFTCIVLEWAKILVGARLLINDKLASVFQFIFFFLTVYLMTSIIMLIFNYYGQKNNSSDRSHCIGENENSNSACEEN